MIESIFTFGQGLVGAGWWTGLAWPTIWALIKVVLVLMLVLTAVTYATLWERKLLGWVQIRLGPNRVGPWGLLQPIADALKLMTKEIVRPTASDKFLFYLGPVLTVAPALAAWAVIPFERISPEWKVIAIDGQSPLHRSFDLETYPLSASISLLTSEVFQVDTEIYEAVYAEFQSVFPIINR